MKRRQILSLVLVGAMSLSVLAGCGNKKATSDQEKEAVAAEFGDSEEASDGEETRGSNSETIDVTVGIWGADA